MASAGQSARGRTGLASVWRDEGWLAIAGPTLALLGCVVSRTNRLDANITLCCFWAILAGAALLRSRLRSELTRTPNLGFPAASFALVIAAALLSLTPYAPGGPHPVWAYLGMGPGAATIDISATRIEIIKLLALGCAFAAGAMSGNSDDRARKAIWSVVALGAAFAAWSVLLYAGDRLAASNRMAAGFGSANTAALLFGVLMVLAAGLLVSRLRRGDERRLTDAALPATAAFTFFVCLLMTASRGAFLSSGAALLLMAGLLVWSGRVRFSRTVLAGAAVVVVVLLVLGVAGDLLLDRLFGMIAVQDTRNTIYQVHWRAFLDAPWMGYGLGTFSEVNRMVANSGNLADIWTINDVHNVYLGWLEQAGIVGALPMFATVAGLVALTTFKAVGRSRMTGPLFALIGADAVVLLHGMSDFALEVFAISSLWAYLLGLQVTLAQSRSRR